MPSVVTRRRQSRTPSQSKNSSPPLVTSSLSGKAGKRDSPTTPDPMSVSNLQKPIQHNIIPGQGRLNPGAPSSNFAQYSTSNKENLNVFAFMETEACYMSGVEDEQACPKTSDRESYSNSTSPSSEPSTQKSSVYRDLEVHGNERQGQNIWNHKSRGRESFASDSGISMRSGSLDGASSPPKHIYPNFFDAPSHDPCQNDIYNFQSSPRRRSVQSPAPHPMSWLSNVGGPNEGPEAYYKSMQQPIPEISQYPILHIPEAFSPVDNLASPAGLYPQHPHAKSNSSGYECLASALSSNRDASLRPIYRKFEALNNRMLLYLQDEICEMEDNLRRLDEDIEHEKQFLGNRSTSRRVEAKQPSQLQWHRMELLGRCFVKVEQYNRALSSYQGSSNTLETAPKSAVNAYRAWATEHAPIAEEELAFLGEEADLVVVSRDSSTISKLTAGDNGELEAPVIIVAFILVSTIIVFKFVPQFVARLVICAVVGVASLCTLSPSLLSDLKNIRDWSRGITIYTAVMLVLAIVVG